MNLCRADKSLSWRQVESRCSSLVLRWRAPLRPPPSCTWCASTGRSSGLTASSQLRLVIDSNNLFTGCSSRRRRPRSKRRRLIKNSNISIIKLWVHSLFLAIFLFVYCIFNRDMIKHRPRELSCILLRVLRLTAGYALTPFDWLMARIQYLINAMEFNFPYVRSAVNQSVEKKISSTIPLLDASI